MLATTTQQRIDLMKGLPEKRLHSLQSKVNNDPSDSGDPLPSSETCILHLRLLASFEELRETISNEDGLFGIFDAAPKSKADLRWTLFVAKAVDRFEQWLSRLFSSDSKLSTGPATCSTVAEIADLLRDIKPLEWSEEMIPTLDVLMVLHSYMLNPRDFLQDCIRDGRLRLWKAGFPWKLLASHINVTSLRDEALQAAQTAYETRISDEGDLVKDNVGMILKCPACSSEVTADWAALYSEDSAQMQKGNSVMPFSIKCDACQGFIGQDSLCMALLQKDFKRLYDNNIPMPGTLLSRNGVIPSSDQNSNRLTEPQILDLNKLLRSELDNGLLKISDPVGSETHPLTLEDVRLRIRNTIDGKRCSQNSSDTATSTGTAKRLHLALKRMISRYTHNFSSFSLDLVGAVIRQGTFISKMHDFDFLHTPHLSHTISHAIQRYNSFFKIMQLHSDHIAVPAFDVDLVWHTHQLTPQSYYTYSLSHCNDIFIDHDDKINDSVLTDSFGWTCAQFRSLTGEEYDKCFCLWCDILRQEALASKPKSNIGRLQRLLGRQGESQAVENVRQLQAQKFEDDYVAATTKESENRLSKHAFFKTYIWHFPMLAPSPDQIKE